MLHCSHEWAQSKSCELLSVWGWSRSPPLHPKVESGVHRSVARALQARGLISKESGRRAEEGKMACYMAASYRVFSGAHLVYIVNDDVRTGGEKNQFGVAWHYHKGVGAWLLPQVCDRVGLGDSTPSIRARNASNRCVPPPLPAPIELAERRCRVSFFEK